MIVTTIIKNNYKDYNYLHRDDFIINKFLTY